MSDPVSEHPNDEWLVAYLTTGLSPQEHRRLNAHLLDCDRCVQTVAVMQRRLTIAAEVAAPVPASIRRRAGACPAADSCAGDTAPSPASLEPLDWIAWVRDRLALVTRISFVVPGAVAAIALAVLVTRTNWMNPTPQHERSRSIQMHQQLRVTASEAAVRREPARHTPVVAMLRRGMPVRILGQDGAWYHVELPDGSVGWMEGNAFE